MVIAVHLQTRLTFPRRFLMREDGSRIIPGHRYHHPAAAIEWLCDVLGFQRHAVYEGEDGKIAHAELTLGSGMIMLGSGKDDEFSSSFKSPDDLGGVETRVAYVIVPNADEVHDRAVSAGARITMPLHDASNGAREFAAKDPEGHTWVIGTYNPWDDSEDL
jgi:uncharacterized glyoxalase superfamily protein PhnB